MAPKYLLAPLAVLTVVMPTPASATSIFDLSIDTTPSSGALAALAFDLVSGNPAPNSVTIENFITDGILGVPSSTNGPVTGLLPAPVTIAT